MRNSTVVRGVATAGVALAGGLAGTEAVAAPRPDPCYEWIRHEKVRAGYMSCADPRTAVRQMRAIGMNAFLPKFGGLTCPPDERNLQLLREWGAAARASGMRFLPVFNFRGGQTESSPGARREVTKSGRRMEATPCPLDEAFWHKHVYRRAVDLATRGNELHIAGAIIDPEMYGADHTVFDDVCYCDDCLTEFLQARGQGERSPLPAAATRADWLKQRELGDLYRERFIDRIKGFCVDVEREVHRRNPDFLLGVLLLDYPHPFMRGLAQGLGTERHPVLGFSETTYFRGYTDYVEAQQKTFAAMPAHVLFVPGLWLAQFPSENLAEQCYHCARASAGYWVYTLESFLEDVSNLPGYALREPDQRYWAAMKAANSELDRHVASRGEYHSVLKVRSFDPPLPVLVLGDAKPEALVPLTKAGALSLGPVTLPRFRYRNPLYVLCTRGEPVRVRVTNQQLNVSYRYGTQYAVVDPAGKRVVEGAMKVGESAVAAWTPESDGVYVILAGSSQNGYSLQVVTEQPFALRASQKQRLTVNGKLGRVYFHVPKGVAGFSLFVKAEGHAAGRGGKLAVYSPDGRVAARLAGDLGTLTELPVPVPASMQDGVWALTGEGITNDLNLHFSPNTSPYVGTDSTRLLVAKDRR